MSKLRIPVTLTSGINEPVVEASEVKDVSFNKNQSEINEDTGRAIGNINNLVVGEDNLVDAINVNSNSIVTLDETKANKVDVQTALDLKANKTDLNSYVNDASYDSNTKRINFKHNSTILAYIDATDFIKDGMVSNVTIENGYLVITFNTDSGQEPIRIALTDIFNPDNYYTKTAIDTKLGTLEFIVPGGNNVTNAINNAVRNINAAIGDLEEEKADKTAITSLQNTKADKADLVNKANKDGYYPRMIVGGSESLIGDVPQTATYTFRRTGGGAIGEPVARLTEIQGNTGVVNQLVQNGNFADGITGWSRIASVTDNIATFNFTTAYQAVKRTANDVNIILGHKYYISIKYKGDENTAANRWFLTIGDANTSDFVSYQLPTPTQSFQQGNAIVAFPSTLGSPSSEIHNIFLYPNVANAGNLWFTDIQCIDLTLEYGAGNEPATVAEFEARIWRDYGKTLDEYIAYTQGKLINCKAVALESVGQNQFNPNSTIETLPVTADSTILRQVIRTKVLAGTYFIKRTGDGTLNSKVVENGIYGSPQAMSDNRIVTVNTNGGEIWIYATTSAIIERNLDKICINLSDAAINGTYRPYKKDVVNLNLTTLTGINPTTGVRETIFPNGAGGGEGWRDAIKVVNGATVAVVNTARVNLGSPRWYYGTQGGNGRFFSDALTPAPWGSTGKAAKIINAAGYVGVANPLGNNDVNMGVAVFSDRFYLRNDSYSDAASFKAAMDGVYFEYQLATPIIYTDLQYADGTPFVLPTNFEVQNDGTERITHTDGEDSIAPVMSAIYGLNAVGFVQDAPKDYTSQATLDSLTSLLSSLTGHTITKTWDAANNKWTFN